LTIKYLRRESFSSTHSLVKDRDHCGSKSPSKFGREELSHPHCAGVIETRIPGWWS
jgi:hypothetical protein